MACPPLRLGDLRNRHLEGERIAQPNIILALARWGAGRREIEPLVGDHIIFRHALAPVIHQAEQLLGARIALFGRALIPGDRQHVVLRETAAGLVHEADRRLRARVTALGGRKKPARPGGDLAQFGRTDRTRYTQGTGRRQPHTTENERRLSHRSGPLVVDGHYRETDAARQAPIWHDLHLPQNDQRRRACRGARAARWVSPSTRVQPSTTPRSDLAQRADPEPIPLSRPYALSVAHQAASGRKAANGWQREARLLREIRGRSDLYRDP